LAAALAPDDRSRIYALHVARPVERGALGANDPRSDVSRRETLAPLLARAVELGRDVHPLTVTSSDAAETICEVARLKGANLIVMGWHRPVFRQSVLGGALERVMRGTDADVAVFIDKGLRSAPRRLLLPYMGTSHDRAALRLAVRLGRRTKSDLTILHVVSPERSKPVLEIEAGRLIETQTSEPLDDGATARLVVVESEDPLDTLLQRADDYDLVIVGIGDEWNLGPGVLGVRQERIAADTSASLLIVRGASGEAASVANGAFASRDR